MNRSRNTIKQVQHVHGAWINRANDLPALHEAVTAAADAYHDGSYRLALRHVQEASSIAHRVMPRTADDVHELSVLKRRYRVLRMKAVVAGGGSLKERWHAYNRLMDAASSTSREYRRARRLMFLGRRANRKDDAAYEL